MKKLLATLILLVHFPQAMAADVIYLNVGDKAPFTGFLFTPEKEHELRLLDEKNTLLEQKITLQTDLLSLSNQRADTFQKQSESLAKTNADSHTEQFWQHTLYFLAGAVITGLVAYGIHRTN